MFAENKSMPMQLTATALLILTLMASLFSRNTGEYFFDLAVLFVLGVTSFKLTPWTFKNLFYLTGFNKVLFVFYAWLILTIIAHPPVEESSIRTLIEFLWIPGLFVFARILNLSKLSPKLMSWFSIFIIISTTILMYKFFTNPEIGTHWGLPNRMKGTFTNTNFLAHSYFLVFLLLLGVTICLQQAKQNASAAIVGLATISILAVLFLTFTRAVWLAVLFAAPATLFFANRKLAIYIFLAFILGFSAIYIADIGGTKERMERSLTPEKTYDAARLALWRTNFKIFKDNPILGVGYMNNKRDIKKYYDYYQEQDVAHSYDTHAHNEILSFLSGTGIPGTVLYISLFILFFILGYKTLPFIKKEDPIRRGLLIGAMAIQPSFLLAGLADNNFEIHIARNWLVISWAILIWLASEQGTTVNFSAKPPPKKINSTE